MDIDTDIARRVPTTGDAFRMMVAGQSFDERKLAGRALVKEILTLIQLQQRGSSVIATIGGFDLVFEGHGYGRGEGYRATVMLQRAGLEHEIDLPLTITPLGAIARLEHTLASFEDERDRTRQRLDDSRRRLASYQPRRGGDFAFASELAEKRRQLAEVDQALSADVEGTAIAA